MRQTQWIQFPEQIPHRYVDSQEYNSNGLSTNTFFFFLLVLYHQPEKMVRSKEDLSERQENLERLKQQHGIE